MEVVPRNVLERTYTICVVMVAMLIFSSFISSVTNAMTRLREINQDWESQMESVQKFMTAKRITLGLGNRIHSFLSHHRGLNLKPLTENDLEVFKCLPTNLHVHLRREIYEPVLLLHPFFSALDQV